MGPRALLEAAAAALAILSLALRLFADRFFFVEQVNSTFTTCRPAFILILLAAAVVLDLPRRGFARWVHWLGVFCFGFGCAMTMATQMVLTMFMRYL